MKKSKKAAAVLLTMSAVLTAVPLPAMAAGPLAVKVNSGYDEETWARLQDNVMEYDEIPDLVHEFNVNIRQTWDDLEKTRQELLNNAEELESHQHRMENLKESAKQEGDMAAIVNYATQEAILGKVSKSMESGGINMLNRKTVASLQQGEDTITQIAQQLMISYDTLTKQRDTLVRLQELYDRQYQMMVDKKELGLATETDVLAAQTNRLSAQGSIQSIDGGLLKLKPTLCTLTGWAADADPVIAPIPPVDMSRMETMNLENDTKKAIGNNHTLIEQRHSALGRTNDGTAARTAYIEEGDQKLTIKMRQLYDDVAAKRTAYEAALAGYESAQKSAEGYERMYGLGLMSEADYLGGMISYHQKKAGFESADMALRLSIETYEWAVKGFVDIE